MKHNYSQLKVTIKLGVLFATVDNPPCNILSVTMLNELITLINYLSESEHIKVMVLQSENPEFFIAHFDATALINAQHNSKPDTSPFHTLGKLLRHNSKPILVKIAGRAGGGGCEIPSCCDMRFGVRGKSILNQMEVPLGIIPGGTGTQNLPRLLGRGRALEMILGADDIDADTAEKWGYFNRIFDDTEEMNNFVDNLAYRIAKWPPHAVALAKESVNNSDEFTWQDSLEKEFKLVTTAKANPITMPLLCKFIELGGQTPKCERDINQLCIDVNDAIKKDVGMPSQSEHKN